MAWPGDQHVWARFDPITKTVETVTIDPSEGPSPSPEEWAYVGTIKAPRPDCGDEAPGFLSTDFIANCTKPANHDGDHRFRVASDDDPDVKVSISWPQYVGED